MTGTQTVVQYTISSMHSHCKWYATFNHNKIVMNSITIITVRDIVSLVTPPKNEAAPTSAMAPGSIHAQAGLPVAVCIPNIDTIARPIILP